MRLEWFVDQIQSYLLTKFNLNKIFNSPILSKKLNTKFGVTSTYSSG